MAFCSYRSRFIGTKVDQYLRKISPSQINKRAPNKPTWDCLRGNTHAQTNNSTHAHCHEGAPIQTQKKPGPGERFCCYILNPNRFFFVEIGIIPSLLHGLKLLYVLGRRNSLFLIILVCFCPLFAGHRDFVLCRYSRVVLPDQTVWYSRTVSGARNVSRRNHNVAP